MPDTVTVTLDAAAAALVLALLREIGEHWQANDAADPRLAPLSRAYEAMIKGVTGC